MRTNIEAIAIKNLQDILRERGYTAETLFSKFDTDGNGVLSKMEFEAALRSITGQVAPQAILNAVFGALDRTRPLSGVGRTTFHCRFGRHS